jgi:hypothetical protein
VDLVTVDPAAAANPPFHVGHDCVCLGADLVGELAPRSRARSGSGIRGPHERASHEELDALNPGHAPRMEDPPVIAGEERAIPNRTQFRAGFSR